MLRTKRRALLCFLIAGFAPLALAQAPAGAAQHPPLSGRVAQEQGLTVLEIWGTPEQAGYAHGYLMAAQMTALFDQYILDPKIIPTPAVFESFVPMVRRVFVWSPEFLAELTALDRGARDRLGEKYRSEKLDRELTLDDLLVANAMADLLHVGCSSFSAWGPYTADGQTLTGRNLDFPYTAAMAKAQLVLVHHGERAKEGWVGVTWPGLIGAYTAMNSAGVTIALHDAPGLPLTDAIGLTPRSLTLREALLKARPESFDKDIQAVLESHRVRVGNNIHVSAPAAAGKSAAAVFEYDGNPRDHGVQVRGPEMAPSDGSAAAGPSAGNPTFLSFLGCTNHMRTRKTPTDCLRYEVIGETFGKLREHGAKIDVASAFELLKKVRQSHTLHSVVFEPAKLRMHVLIPAIQEKPAIIDVKEWLTHPTVAGAAR